MSQQTSSPCGLFSRAENKLKLSNDEIDEFLLVSPRLVELYLDAGAPLAQADQKTSISAVSSHLISTTRSKVGADHWD